jgi:hypothetical protein
MMPEMEHSEFPGLSERVAAVNRASMLEGIGYHPFVESEFAPGCGRCDTCGGGPLADVHQKPVDQMARVADALERIAAVLEAWRGDE